MTVKPTNLGNIAPETDRLMTPTRFGDTGGGAEPAQPTVHPTMRPTAIQPAVIPPAATPLVATPTALAPTALKQAAAPAAPVQPEPRAPTTMVFATPVTPSADPVKASALPGTQRKPLDVPYETLASRFPGQAPRLLEQVQAILSGMSPQTMDSVAWLSFGVPIQEVLAGRVKQRLTLMEAPTLRTVVQHLSRLQALLREVLDAMDGGFLKKSVTKVWDAVMGEVQLLEDQLTRGYPHLVTILGHMADLSQQNQDTGEELQAHVLAAEYLTDLLDAQAGQLLLSRMLALSTSQALVLEQLQTLTLDRERVQELMTLVQDGVLLQLPSVYSQLAGLSAKPSDTQRFMAAEKLTELVQYMQRKL